MAGWRKRNKVAENDHQKENDILWTYSKSISRPYEKPTKLSPYEKPTIVIGHGQEEEEDRSIKRQWKTIEVVGCALWGSVCHSG